MKRIALMTAVLFASAPALVHAARPWLLPSQTVLARSGGWVAVDAAMADDLFSVNQGALPVDTLVVRGPDGQTVAPQNVAKSRSRSSFDLELRQPGTYRLTVAESHVMARWEEDGKPKRWRGAGADMAANIPAGAAKLEVEEMLRRVETFVTVGAPSEIKAEAVSKGFTLVPVTHPNDLYVKEEARFRLLLDGNPAADLEVSLIAGGTRYRDSPEELRVKTDRQGEISVTWPAAGLYWLEASIEDDRASAPNVKKRRASYNATLEVLPQ
jgi:uncharacterized GH25 family protein